MLQTYILAILHHLFFTYNTILSNITLHECYHSLKIIFHYSDSTYTNVQIAIRYHSLYPPHPRIIQGWIRHTRNLRILRPATEGAAYVYPILGSSQDGYSILGIPEYSDTGGSLHVCLPHPRIIPGWIQYTRNPRILQQRGQLMYTPS